MFINMVNIVYYYLFERNDLVNLVIGLYSIDCLL